METVTDWLELWKEIVTVKMSTQGQNGEVQAEDYWKEKVRHFKAKSTKSQANSSSSRQLIASKLKENPDSTLLDIGAGSGDWCESLATYAKKITALEPSDTMAELIVERIRSGRIENIEWVKGKWPGIDIEPHDFTLASHSMYGETNFKPFIEKMISCSRRGCFLILKVLFTKTIMAKASRRILGQPYDSPCFQIAYNALHQMGIFPNVMMDRSKTWKSWSNNSMEEALEDIKNRFGIASVTDHDDFLISLLESDLTEKDGKFFWPVGVGSALVYWDVC